VVCERRPGTDSHWRAHAFPALSLLLVMLPIVKFDSLSLLVWPVVLAVDALVLALAVVPILVSMLYQRFVAPLAEDPKPGDAGR